MYGIFGKTVKLQYVSSTSGLYPVHICTYLWERFICNMVTFKNSVTFPLYHVHFYSSVIDVHIYTFVCVSSTTWTHVQYILCTFSAQYSIETPIHI